ncbi:MAG: hypothetical protein ABI616_04885 [Pseudomonadota bacterium]
MRLIHPGSIAGGCIAQLAKEIFIVLTRQARAQSRHVTLPEISVAVLADLKVHERAILQGRSITDGFLQRWKPRHGCNIRGNVCQILGGGQVMTIGEVLHPFVPALLVTEVDQLFQQHGAVLSGDGWHAPICNTLTLLPMAGSAGLVAAAAVVQIGSQFGGSKEFGSCRGGFDIGTGHDAIQKQSCSQSSQ